MWGTVYVGEDEILLEMVFAQHRGCTYAAHLKMVQMVTYVYFAII